MAGQSGAIGENGVIADHAIVRHVSGRHKQIVASDASYTTALHGSATHCYALTEYVAIAHVQARALARILQILRLTADSGKGMQHVCAAQARWAIHYGMGVQDALFAQHYIAAHYGISPDADSGA
jgi:hypothetical protein